jgi:hypothetical protein
MPQSIMRKARSKKEPDYLFNGEPLSDFLTMRHADMLRAIDALSTDYLLNASLEDLVGYLSDKYRLEPITLSDTPEIAEHRDTEINPVEILFVVAFAGDPEIFHLRPSTSGTFAPLGKTIGPELHITIGRPDHDPAAMRRQFDQNMSNIRSHLEWGTAEITTFNDQLPQLAKQRLESRKTRLLADKGMVAALGFPMRQRPSLTATYPLRRKRLVISKPPVPSSPFQPEPALEMDHYEHILTVMSNMVLVMERSPSAFSRMDEDTLRTHILVQLNGHYEGQATGETFNAAGKTDILIRVDGRNIFIAECKYWIGADSLHRAVGQLLDYTAWRDTKTAVVMFNRNKNLSAVVGQVPEVVRSHPNFKRDIPLNTSQDFVLSSTITATKTASSSSPFSSSMSQVAAARMQRQASRPPWRAASRRPARCRCRPPRKNSPPVPPSTRSTSSIRPLRPSAHQT